MITVAGMPFQQMNNWPAGSVEYKIIQEMSKAPVVYAYSSINHLLFEVNMRKSIIKSARALNDSSARFAVFETSRANPRYWYVTPFGGFQQRQDVRPSDAILDIYKNSSRYAFECATAKVIVYYYAVLNVLGEPVFNQAFPSIHLYSWHADPDLGLKARDLEHVLPGDVVYFKNAEFDPNQSQWRGENAVVLEDGTYYGHGLGIGTAEQIIAELNKKRKPGASQPAYLSKLVVRPSFHHLANLAFINTRGKHPHAVIQHNQASVSYDYYSFLLHAAYQKWGSYVSR
ncbi:protein-glutamine gamma-glutamyltransferase [Bacillus sp. REN10]|uniref:protein-glutamine gamma-glutamyltransferase n=1 Tax=Bacillus sp. REN10 TaxID=2782541 RepID=UPI00193B8F4D|nr:protein-glutamine gamma-glutamyltransferase [Bacillus sp. REN10]